MTERDLYGRVSKELQNPVAIEALEIGTMPGRFVKPRDGFGRDKQGRMIRIPNPVDLLWVVDYLELKAVKARTEKGMVFYLKAIEGKQLEFMRERNALLAVAFILDGKDKPDRLVAIPVFRFHKIDVWKFKKLTMYELEATADYTVKGEAYSKIVPKQDDQ